MSEDEAELARLLAASVPELSAGTIAVKAVARQRGYRSKLALASNDPAVDAVGACVGVRGCRIRQVMDQLDGERIDMFRWTQSVETLMEYALQPVHILQVILSLSRHRATVVVPEWEESFALGRHGINRDLAGRICGWAIDIVTENP